MLKPMSSNPPPSYLVPRLVYAPPLLLLLSEFIKGTVSDSIFELTLANTAEHPS